jgi:intracellular sulfur oxidation DsrE/DsrF family protein
MISRRAFLSALVAVGGLAAAVGQPALAEGATGQKVVFQVSDADPKKWALALNNANNVLQALGKGKVDIEIVAYGPGIAMLKLDSTAGNGVADAVGNGIRVVACENTMKAQKLTQADILPEVGFVPAGVVELMKRQQEGYAYIRP